MTTQTAEVNHDGMRHAQAPIDVKNLDFAYGQKQVLYDVSFSLAKAPVGLLGPNGSGKTTLLRALLGHLRVKSGTVTAMGCDMASDPYGARRRIGWMPERGGIIPGMSGVSMVAYLGELSGMPRTDALQRAHEVLNYVGLADERYRKADTYSQGMRQRLKLAQALVHDPDWIFLDEPTSGLDPSGRISMLELMRDLALKKDFGVIISTHLLADVKSVCSEILVLREGRLLEHGKVKPDEYSDTQTFSVEGFGEEVTFIKALETRGATWTRDDRVLLITIPSTAGSKVVLEAAKDTGYALRRLQKRSETLEDVFFRLVDDSEGGV
jgi:ABC-2 type transport system ATP-binding protein